MTIDILAQIIAVAIDKPVIKTGILYDCFSVHYDYLNECLNILVKSGLIRRDYKKTNTFIATEKGLHYLELCTALRKDPNYELNNT